MKNRVFFLIGLLFCCQFFHINNKSINAASAQELKDWEIASPLDFETTLSGSFAEMRKNHFHGGLDLRTNGEENKPVRAIDDGYVAKITISRTSYGKCAFINHPNGYTSVYGHLNGFVPALDSLLKSKQYAEHQFETTLELDSSQFPVKKGQVFAKSGNTGASGGPHVHFEIRKTSDGTMRNPLELKNRPYGFSDDKKPRIFAIKLYGLNNQGVVNGENQKVFNVIVGKDKSRKIQALNGISAWGKIGFAVKANDYMSATAFKYSPRHLRVYADGKLISDIKIDSFLYKDIRACNSFVDYAQWSKTRDFFMKSFKDENSPLIFMKGQPYGTLTINEERDYRITYLVEDDFCNKDSVSFIISGKKEEISSEGKDSTLYIKCGENVFFDKKTFAMKFERKSLYEDLRHNFSKDTSANNFFSAVYSIGDATVPLHNLCPISIKVDKDTLTDKSKYYIAKLNNHNIASGSAGGEYIDGFIVGKTNTFGKFAIDKDVTPPVIAPVHTNQLRNLPYLRLKIYDTQSGIDTYDGYIDNVWVMFEYDAKTQQVTYWLDKKQIKEFTNHTFKLIVKDYCGNVKEYTKQIYW